MPDQQYKVVEVRSNVDRLSVSAVHRLFSDMVGRVAHSGEDFMRMVTPKGKTLRLSRAVSSSGPHDEGDYIEAAVGIPHISEADSPRGVPYFPGEQDAGAFPLFVDRGTGVFGPAHAPIYGRRGPMRFENAAGDVFFRSKVEGQPAKHFMLATFEEMHRAALPADARIFAEHVQHLYLEPSTHT